MPLGLHHNHSTQQRCFFRKGLAKHREEGDVLVSFPPCRVNIGKLVLESASRIRIDRDFEIPSIPILLIKILQLLYEDEESAKKLEELILHDLSLSSHILKIANSAYYSLRNEVKTISHAIVLLGMNLVRSLAIGVGIFDHFAKGMKCEAALINELWMHSFGVGLLTQEIWTRRRGRKEGDFAFLCGLLHDLGKVVFFKNYPTHYCFHFASEKSQTDPDISTCEFENFNTDHATVGATLTKQWGLPSELSDVLKKHHYPLQSDSLLVCAVSISDMLAKQGGIGYDGDYKITEDFSKLQMDLCISDEEYANLKTLVEFDREQAEAFFN